MVASNYEAAFIAKLEQIIVSSGGLVPPMTGPTNFQVRSLELLDALNVAAGSSTNASSVAFTPAGSITAANVQAAIAELDSEAPFLPVGATIDYEGLIDGTGILTENNLIWLLLDGATIGNSASGASRYADVKSQALYTKLWTNTNLAIFTSAGVSTTRGADALSDFNGNKRLTLPDLRGRVMVPAGMGPGLSAKPWGQIGGAETHLLAISEMPQHSHNLDMSAYNSSGFGNVTAIGNNTGIIADNGYTKGTGGGQAHNNMQPFYVTAGKLILVGRA